MEWNVHPRVESGTHSPLRAGSAGSGGRGDGASTDAASLAADSIRSSFPFPQGLPLLHDHSAQEGGAIPMLDSARVHTPPSHSGRSIPMYQDGGPPGAQGDMLQVEVMDSSNPEDEATSIINQGCAFQGATLVALVTTTTTTSVDGDARGGGEGGMVPVDSSTKLKEMQIVLEDGVMLTVELDSGERRLVELGYTQTLQRDLSQFEVFAAGFACMGLFVGVIPYYGAGFFNGGPVAVVWYWLVTAFFSTCMVASLAEIASSFPLAGSMYFWAAYMAPPKYAPIASWFTGWLELTGTTVGAGGVALLGVTLLLDVARLASTEFVPGTSPDDPGQWVSTTSLGAPAQFGIACAVLVVIAAVNCLRVRTLGQLLAGSTVIQILLALVFIVCLPVVAPTTQPASFVLGTYLNNWEGYVPTAAYAVVMALLLPQYSQFGVNTVAHFAEEAARGDLSVPMSMLASQALFVLLGWGILLSLTFSIQNVDALYMDPLGVGPGKQIIFDAFYARFYSGTGACVFLGLMFLSFFAVSLSLIFAGGRVAYSLARDGGFPFASFFSVVSSEKVPVRAVLLCWAISTVSLIPSIFSPTFHLAVTSMGSVGFFCAYLLPMFFRVANAEETFSPGPFYMARHLGVIGGKVVHSLGLLYVLYTICVFLIPNTFPITASTFNYAPVGIILVVVVFSAWWVLDARQWYTGPFVLAKTPGVESGRRESNDKICRKDTYAPEQLPGDIFIESNSGNSGFGAVMK